MKQRWPLNRVPAVAATQYVAQDGSEVMVVACVHWLQFGETQHHPHGQAYGVSIMPSALQHEVERAIQVEAGGRGCPICRVRAELSGDVYEVAANTSGQCRWTGQLERGFFQERFEFV
jgi:hypothetical protein